jgi:hypothetical protein
LSMRYSLKRDCDLSLEAIRFDGVSKSTLIKTIKEYFYVAYFAP